MVKTDKSIPPLIPYTEGVVNASGGPHLSCQGIIRKVEEGNSKGLAFSNCSKCVAQVLRSSGRWSLGVKCERSVYNCMLRLIETSEKLIYIENQYFVAGFGTTGDDFDEESVRNAGGEGDLDEGASPGKGSDDGLVLNGIGEYGWGAWIERREEQSDEALRILRLICSNDERSESQRRS